MRHPSLMAGSCLPPRRGAAVAQSGDKLHVSHRAEIQVQGDVVPSAPTPAGWLGRRLLEVRARDRNYDAHLAPATFLKMLDLELAAGTRSN